MRAILQKVTEASVTIENEVTAKIGPGLLVLLGICRDDTEKDIEFILNKLLNLRVLPGEGGTFDRSITETAGEILIVSQFTLYGETKKGRRPDFALAMAPAAAKVCYEKFVENLISKLPERVKTGVFQAHMQVQSINDGPITLFVDSK